MHQCKFDESDLLHLILVAFDVSMSLSWQEVGGGSSQKDLGLHTCIHRS